MNLPRQPGTPLTRRFPRPDVLPSKDSSDGTDNSIHAALCSCGRSRGFVATWALISIALVVILAGLFTLLGILDPGAIPGRSRLVRPRRR
jgi:hypothetical protein